ncbi:helix-hairpin-helix domain-containing protein [Streptomyces sp. NBC_00285]|uniref:helix-hairpin-helix domain-containing protein n=1 Tax=Streptomyces sp. NBC_00285 TaxID=2975700 RepID=UPI003FA693C3
MADGGAGAGSEAVRTSGPSWALDAVGSVAGARRERGAVAEDSWAPGPAEETWREAGSSAEEAWREAGSSGEGRRDAGSGKTASRDDGAGDVDWRPPDPGRGAWRERAGFALRERMPVWLQARCGLERRNVVALSVLLVVAAVFAVQHFWTGRTQDVQAPEVVRAGAPFGEGGTNGDRGSGPRGEAEPAASGGVSSTAGTAGAVIVVDVSGKVREPGVHRLPTGSRVADALKAAGGVRPGTNTDALNRARFLVDGEQVVVGGPAAAPAPGVGGPVTGGGPVGAAAAPVSLNTATVEQLDTLPGVGPVLARHILDYRTQHGGFRSVDELREVNGIGDRRFADLRNLVRP